MSTLLSVPHVGWVLLGTGAALFAVAVGLKVWDDRCTAFANLTHQDES